MPPIIDLTGKKFFMLTVKRFDRIVHGAQSKWIVVCECGTEKSVYGFHLRTGDIVSCGCWRRKSMGDRMRTHGDSKSVEFRIWYGIILRCTDSDNPAYIHYGGRGITVCKRWMKYENFLEDMGRLPRKGMTIERKNNDRGYSPCNCKWATMREQNNNKRSNIKATYKGETKTCGQWANELGLHYRTLIYRIKKGYKIQQIIDHKNAKKWAHY